MADSYANELLTWYVGARMQIEPGENTQNQLGSGSAIASQFLICVVKRDCGIVAESKLPGGPYGRKQFTRQRGNRKTTG